MVRLMGAAKVLAKPFPVEPLNAAVNELLAEGEALAPPPGPA